MLYITDRRGALASVQCKKFSEIILSENKDGLIKSIKQKFNCSDINFLKFKNENNNYHIHYDGIATKEDLKSIMESFINIIEPNVEKRNNWFSYIEEIRNNGLESLSEITVNTLSHRVFEETIQNKFTVPEIFIAEKLFAGWGYCFYREVLREVLDERYGSLEDYVLSIQDRIVYADGEKPDNLDFAPYGDFFIIYSKGFVKNAIGFLSVGRGLNRTQLTLIDFYKLAGEKS